MTAESSSSIAIKLLLAWVAGFLTLAALGPMTQPWGLWWAAIALVAMVLLDGLGARAWLQGDRTARPTAFLLAGTASQALAIALIEAIAPGEPTAPWPAAWVLCLLLKSWILKNPTLAGWLAPAVVPSLLVAWLHADALTVLAPVSMASFGWDVGVLLPPLLLALLAAYGVLQSTKVALQGTLAALGLMAVMGDEPRLAALSVALMAIAYASVPARTGQKMGRFWTRTAAIVLAPLGLTAIVLLPAAGVLGGQGVTLSIPCTFEAESPYMLRIDTLGAMRYGVRKLAQPKHAAGRPPISPLVAAAKALASDAWGENREHVLMSRFVRPPGELPTHSKVLATFRLGRNGHVCLLGLAPAP